MAGQPGSQANNQSLDIWLEYLLSQASVLRSVLFSSFISDLGDKTEHISSKFVEILNQREWLAQPTVVFWSRGTLRNLIIGPTKDRFHHKKGKDLYLGQNNPFHQPSTGNQLVEH